ncbi:hypothetical protein [Thiomonas bhubaneswarensis]|uniref:Uncharacterized protein n=1 Tax=Thiomonas bhubaneswarensis TaxID=339866 RepID=A0A0K6I1L9_9BURK|nr:hypothetical protein [Thiomonas bhubaneswarensis]CUA96981.1 hypothetical protein Ga0061069_10547 [Thiomonas bhubaneswarensis]
MLLRDSFRCMLKEDVQESRRRILQRVIDEEFGGNEAAFGRRLGYKDGAFVRQMLSGGKAITEKTVIKIVTAIPKLNGWFSSAPPIIQAQPHELTLSQILDQLALAVHRVAPDKREAVADLLHALALHPGELAIREALEKLMQSSTTHNTRAAVSTNDFVGTPPTANQDIPGFLKK